MSDPPPPHSPNQAAPPPPPPPPQIIIQQEKSAFGRYGRVLLALLIFAAIWIIGMKSAYQSYFSTSDGTQEKYHSLSKSATKKVAIVDISGTILEGDGFVKKQLDRVRDDENVVALVLRIDSPGGTVTASDYLYHHVKKLAEERHLPVVVSMGSMCASGGYYIAMSVGNEKDVIFAEPTTWTGSIGVVIPHYDFSGLLAEISVKDDSIASRQDKLMGSPTRELSDQERKEERELFEKLVSISFDRFKDIVRSGRPQLRDDDKAFDEATTGQIFTAEQALELHLVDRIGFIEDAVERAVKLSGLSKDKLMCVKYKQPASPLDMLMSSSAARPPKLVGDLQTLFDLSMPKAYYLCAPLPGGILRVLGGD